MRNLVSKLKAGGALRPGLTTAYAAGLLSVLCSTKAFTGLTTRHGWTASQWETRTTNALRQLLLQDNDARQDAHPPAPDSTSSPSSSTQRQQPAER